MLLLSTSDTDLITARASGADFLLRNPARLAQNMKEVNTKRKLVRVLPSERAVEQLIAQARKLPPKITY